jgi:hypothetical protein
MSKPPKRRLKVSGKVLNAPDPVLPKAQPRLGPLKDAIVPPMPPEYSGLPSVVQIAPVLSIHLDAHYTPHEYEHATLTVEYRDTPTSLGHQVIEDARRSADRPNPQPLVSFDGKVWSIVSLQLNADIPEFIEYYSMRNGMQRVPTSQNADVKLIGIFHQVYPNRRFDFMR